MMRSRRCTVSFDGLDKCLWDLITFAAGHYLNLPVVEPEGKLVAIVDVLKLTYATLEQVCICCLRPLPLVHVECR